VKKKTTGRPAASTNVRIVPEFRQEPDVVKLARAFVSVAEKSATVPIRSPTEQKVAA